MTYDVKDNLPINWAILRQHVLVVKVRLDVYTDDNTYVDSIECGIISASNNVSADSDVRRAASLELYPMKSVGTIVSENGLLWLNKNIKLFVGLEIERTHEMIWYPQGVYMIMTTSSTYDASTNTLSLSLSDWMARLDGSRNGNLSFLTYLHPSYREYLSSLWIEYAKVYGKVTSQADVFNWFNTREEYQNAVTQGSQAVQDAAWQLVTNYDSLSDSQIETYMNLVKGAIYPEEKDQMKLKNIVMEQYRTKALDKNYVVTSISEHNKIRDAMITTVSQLGYINDYNIDYIGERKGMPNYSPTNDYLKYREEHPYWDDIPFDQEFSAGSTVLNIITALRDLYEDYECYFDVYNQFCCNMIPDGLSEETVLDDDFFQSILISENLNKDFSEVKNVTDVWGQAIEPDFYCETPATYSGNVYNVTNDAYTEEYYNGDQIAISLNDENQEGASINVNSFGVVPIYDENYDTPIRKGVMQPKHVYVLKIKKTRDTKEKKDILKAYYIGEYQIHAMDVLKDGSEDDIDVQVLDANNPHQYITVKKYSKEWFYNVYYCDNVHFTVIPESPFTIEKLGIILNYYENDDITSQPTAKETAIQENWRKNRLTDNITITTKICPWADVNIKVSYRPSCEDKPKEYIVKNLSHDLAGATTTWTLMSFYNTYIETEGED